MKVVIVFSGYNPRAVLAFIRTLENSGVSYGVIAKKGDDSIDLTSYATKVRARRNKKELDMDDIAHAIQEVKTALPADEYVIAPSTEALNRFLLSNRSHFESLGCVVPLVSRNLYEQISDKYSFGDLCKENGITVPTSYKSLEVAKIPFVAKPKTYTSSSGVAHNPVLINGKLELEKFLKEYKTEDFYYQEFVDGTSHYLLYFFHAGGTCCKTSQINYMQQPGGKSMVAAVTSGYFTTDESKKYEQLFHKVGFEGLVMVEIKQKGDIAYMIEANPRFWGPSQLFVDQGINLFECFLYEAGVVSKKPIFMASEIPYRYFWQGGIVQAEKEGGIIAYHGYDLQKYEAEKEDWIAADVYNRADSKAVYNQEVEAVWTPNKG